MILLRPVLPYGQKPRGKISTHSWQAFRRTNMLKRLRSKSIASRKQALAMRNQGALEDRNGICLTPLMPIIRFAPSERKEIS